MSDRFDWEHADEIDERRLAVEATSAPGKKRWRMFVALLLVAVVALVAGYVVVVRQATIEATATIRLALDVARDACRAGDEELFFSLQTGDRAWRASLLQPEFYEPICAGQSIVDLQPVDTGYVATLTGDDDIRRLSYFQLTNAGTRRTTPPIGYWGKRYVLPLSGGNELIFRKIDELFTPRIVAFVDEKVQALCADGGCRDGAQPFTLEIHQNFRRTIAPNKLYVPSPRLLGLDANSNPTPAFWEAISMELAAHLRPGVIRFAVPPRPYQAILYDDAAAEFMRQNPDIVVQIETLDLLPEETNESLLAYDGAAYPPSAAMIAAGAVLDLTDYAIGDPDFRSADFYKPLLSGAQWRNHLWFVPHAGQMRFLYYDRNAYQLAGLPEPSPDRQWSDLESDIEALHGMTTATFDGWNGEWAFLDATRDILFAHAYANADCATRPVPCALTGQEVGDALDWYRTILDEGIAPDLAASPPADRLRLMANEQGVPRRAAVWVDDAVNYEHYLQMWPVGVSPFPAGSTPLWVHGSFINRRSERPRDVWRWLVFLSHQPLNGPLRYVPARQSIARQARYWQSLPQPLQAAALQAFRTAQPVWPGGHGTFLRGQLDEALRGNSPANPASTVRWFGH